MAAILAERFLKSKANSSIGSDKKPRVYNSYGY